MTKLDLVQMEDLQGGKFWGTGTGYGPCQVRGTDPISGEVRYGRPEYTQYFVAWIAVTNPEFTGGWLPC